MDSPESTKSTTTTCETSIVQDSPVFSYISNLSPIQPVKAPSVTQGFPGLNSPPLVFTSPRLNPQSQPTFLKRAQFPRPSFAKLSGQLEDGKNCITTVEGNEDLDVQPSTSLVVYGEKGSGSNNTVNDLIQRPCEQFLTDIVIVESVDPDFSFDSTIKKSEYNDQLQEAVTCSKEVIVKLDHGNNSRKSEEIAVVPPVISSQTEEVYKENTLINVSVAEENEKQGDGVSNHCPKVGPELPVVSDMANQEEADSLTENVEAGENVPFDQSSRLLLGSDDIGQESKNSVEAAGTTSAHFFHKVRNDLQAFQHRWARRRCLQFEDAQHKVVSEQPAQDHSNSEGAKSPSLETPLCPTNREHDDVIQPMLYPRNSLNSLIKIPKPTGIGLHLNSIVNTVQAGSSAIINVKAAQWGEFSGLGKNLTSVVNSHLSNYSNSSSTLPLPESDLANTDVHESHASVTADSTMDLSNHGVKPSNNSVVLNSKANQSTPGNKRKDTERSVGSQEFNNLSPEKKRMKSPDSSDGDGCKRCNCKRSKCLKLYCDCFAAGIYCAEPCACQDCFNRPEYEDTVLDTRQRIESRDPFAFAPKVVGGIIEQPASSYGEDGTLFTPASARHKKGCKCKKSMCLKKYCECYQSNVGCSDGCRCEGCKNVYGKKGEFGMTKVVLTGDNTNETTDDSFFDKCQLVASENATYSTQYVNPQALTPLTPAVQFSNHGKDASKVWFPSYPQSPESGSTYVAPYVISPEPPRNSDNNMPKEYPDLVSLDQGSHHGNADTTDEFSAARRKPGMTAPGFGMPNFQKWPYNSKAQSFSANINDYSGGTLIWRGSPVTPTAQFNESKVLQGVEFDVDLSNMLPDGTPEILRDTTAPLNTVKVSSPNKKRVTPPHGQPCVFGSSSSVGIRTGRKFILKAVPSFPPLTPCVDSKTSAAQQESNPENHSANK